MQNAIQKSYMLEKAIKPHCVYILGNLRFPELLVAKVLLEWPRQEGWNNRCLSQMKTFLKKNSAQSGKITLYHCEKQDIRQMKAWKKN